MSMMGEVATEGTIRMMVVWIDKRLKKETNAHAREALKAAGRHALTLFDWSTPEWAAAYKERFAPEKPR